MTNILLSGQANFTLARHVAKLSKIKLGRVAISQFPGGEKYVRIEKNLKNQNVFIMQSCFNPTNEHLIELLILIDAAQRLKPKTITTIIPFYPYRRQEKQCRPGESVTAQLVAKLLKATGSQKIIAVELHAEKIIKFLSRPVIHIRTLPLFSQYFQNKFKNLNDFLVVAPDGGSAKISRALAKTLKIPVVTLTKTRLAYNQVKITKLTSNVANKNVILLDDEISTGSTLSQVAQSLKKQGANDIYAAVTHGAFAENAVEKINRAPIKEIIITDTITQSKKHKKIRVLSVASLISQAINTKCRQEYQIEK